MDITSTVLNLWGVSINGLLVSAFTPVHFIILVIVMGFMVILYRFGNLIFKKKNNCSTCFQIIRISDAIRARKIYEIETSILRDQMAFADLVLDTIKTKIIDIYRRQIDKLGINPQQLKDELDVYTAFIEVQNFRAMDWLRVRLKQNHLEEKTDKEFDSYCTEVVNKLIVDTRMGMSIHWNNFFSVPIADNKMYIQDIQMELFQDIKSVFIKARQITRDRQKTIKEIDAEYDKEMEKLLNKVQRGEL